MTTITKPVDVKLMLEIVARDWIQRRKEVLALSTAISADLNARLSNADRNNLAYMADRFGDAVQDLTDRARSPELTLATTGTTSSGKSTLANFLIGDEILPSAVQEMSAGLVTISHHAQRHTLTIPSTRGATWETGVWDNLEAAEVRNKLEHTMRLYREAAQVDSQIEPVRFEIDWPIRLARQTTRLMLPEGTRIKLIDLPGLKSIGDAYNGNVIRDNIREALCLVAYNAEETDSDKQRELLTQVVTQVMALRNSPQSLGRMLFLLNRIDAFTRNQDPEQSLTDFKQAITRQLRDRLLHSLPEEQEVINMIEPCTISSLPALWATQAISDLGESGALLEKVEKHFGAMFPGKYFHSYPRDFADLSEDQRRHLTDDTLRYANADAFEEALIEHIGKHLPEIVLSGAVNKAFCTAGTLLAELDRLIEANVDRTKDEVNKAKALLNEAENKLQAEAEKAFALFSTLAKTSGESFDLQDLGQALTDIEKDLGLPPEKLTAIRDVQSDSVDSPYRQVSDFCDAVLRGKKVDPGNIADVGNFKELQASLERLAGNSYRETVLQGGKLPDNAEAKQLAEALKHFASQFVHAMTDLSRMAANNGGERCSIAFKIVCEALLDRLQKEGNLQLDQAGCTFEGLRTVFQINVKFPPYQSAPINFDFRINSEQRLEQKDQSGAFRSFFAWLGWVERDIKIVEHKELAIPPLGEMLKTIYEGIAGQQSKQGRILRKNISDYITGNIRIFGNELRNSLDQQINGYIAAIDHSAYELEDQKREKLQSLAVHKNAVTRILREQEHWNEWNNSIAHVDAEMV